MRFHLPKSVSSRNSDTFRKILAERAAKVLGSHCNSFLVFYLFIYLFYDVSIFKQ